MMSQGSIDPVDERYPHSETTGKVIGAAQEVHRQLGPGFREILYGRALAQELPAHGLEFEREVKIPIHYKGKEIGRQRVDFVVEDILLEIKAKGELEPADLIQALSYLKASPFEVGLLLNFGARSLQVKRLINKKH